MDSMARARARAARRNARLLLAIFLFALAVSLLLVAPMWVGVPPSPTNVTRELICPELASQIRWTSDAAVRRSLEAEYDHRCPDSPPPTAEPAP
jgi:hypothetical protein